MTFSTLRILTIQTASVIIFPSLIIFNVSKLNFVSLLLWFLLFSENFFFLLYVYVKKKNYDLLFLHYKYEPRTLHYAIKLLVDLVVSAFFFYCAFHKSAPTFDQIRYSTSRQIVNSTVCFVIFCFFQTAIFLVTSYYLIYKSLVSSVAIKSNFKHDYNIGILKYAVEDIPLAKGSFVKIHMKTDDAMIIRDENNHQYEVPSSFIHELV